VLTVVADDQLAAATHPVTLAAPVPVLEVGERVTRGRLLSHASWWPAGPTLWEADRRAPGRASAQPVGLRQGGVHPTLIVKRWPARNRHDRTPHLSGRAVRVPAVPLRPAFVQGAAVVMRVALDLLADAFEDHHHLRVE
jgi:hypothetical protein